MSKTPEQGYRERHEDGAIERRGTLPPSVKKYHFGVELGRHTREASLEIVGDPSSPIEEQKEEMGRYAAEESVRQIAEFLKDNPNKYVLWNMATGKTFNWQQFLPTAAKKYGFDHTRVIPMIKEEVWDRDGKHFPPGHEFDFRGKRIKAFHDTFGLKPKTVSVTDSGEIEGNLFASDYDMSPAEAARYMNETWRKLMATGKVNEFTTTGVGPDMHVGEMQINQMGLDRMLEQQDFFILPIEEYSKERGMFRWEKPDGTFYPNTNVYVEKDEAGEWHDVEIGKKHSGFGWTMGIGWRQMRASEAGAIFVLDTESKALAFRAALEGSFKKAKRWIKDDKGQNIKELQFQGAQERIAVKELMVFVKELIEKKILSPEVLEEKGRNFEVAGRSTENQLDIFFRLLDDIYKAYEIHDLSPRDEVSRKQFFEPLWHLTNEYLGMRSPFGRQFGDAVRNGLPVRIIATPAACKEIQEWLP